MSSNKFTSHDWSVFILKIMKKGGWTKSAFTRELNKCQAGGQDISESTVGNWVKGRPNSNTSLPSFDNMERVAALLGVKLHELVRAVQEGEDPVLPDLAEDVLPVLQRIAKAGERDKLKLVARLQSQMEMADVVAAASVLLQVTKVAAS
jgi:transcriptional regulator with XRE-family HTH domain